MDFILLLVLRVAIPDDWLLQYVTQGVKKTLSSDDWVVLHGAEQH